MELLKKDNKGFTIIEALVAIVILTVLLLGLLSAFLTTYEYSTRNLIRDEAVKIANEYAEKYRNMDVTTIPTSLTETVNRKIRNGNVQYTVEVASTDLITGKIKQITIKVSWTYKGKTYTHQIKSIVGS